MIFSKPKHFNKSKVFVEKARAEIVLFLELKNLDVDYYLKAYDYFVENPTEFDGATLTKDLKDLYVDFSAMRHDYDYIVLLKKHKGLTWLKQKTKYDYDYAKNIERLGKGGFSAWSRFVGLLLITPFYWVMVKTK